MKDKTLADVFAGPELKASTRRLFSHADLEKTADLAAAKSIDNTSDLVDSMVANATDRLLDISLNDIMMGAWTKMRAIREFAQGEKLSSGRTHKYVLTEHKITSKHAPKIELFVYDNKVAEVVVDISLTLVIAKTKLLIKQGRIMEVRISGCQAMGRLSCLGQTILERQSTELDFPGTIKLGDGIEIPPPLKQGARQSNEN